VIIAHTACCAANYCMDRNGGRPLRSVMARRNVFDPLEPSDEPRWFVVRDERSALVEARPLPAGADLKRNLVAAMLDRIDAGWQLGEFSSRGGSVFFTRGSERCSIGIEAADPGRPVAYGASHLTESPGYGS
jgi:hypothetical protein